jgi:hypothetical protein
MKTNTFEYLTVGMSLILSAGLFAVTFQRDSLKQEAVDRGFAEWVVKGPNKTEFKWKENK